MNSPPLLTLNSVYAELDRSNFEDSLQYPDI
jgi:hypothetical protein